MALRLSLDPIRVLVFSPRFRAMLAHSSVSILKPMPKLCVGDFSQLNTSLNGSSLPSSE